MFKEERDKYRFRWEDLGNIGEGRSNLGSDAPVWAYRLLQYTFRDLLITRVAPEKASEILIEAGKIGVGNKSGEEKETRGKHESAHRLHGRCSRLHFPVI